MISSVKPEKNDYPWDPQKGVNVQKVVVSQRLEQNVVLVLAGLGIKAGLCQQVGHCSEVFFNTGLTVCTKLCLLS